MNKKKIISILAAGVMTLSILSGCAKTEETKPTEPVTETSTTEVASGKYTDGTYKVAYDFIDGHGWKPQIEILIKDKKISEVKFDYVNPAGELKSVDAAYNAAMKPKAGTSPEEYVPILNKKLLETQDVDKVDVVTGATHSTENFKVLAKAALAKAEKGDTSDSILAMNDIYTASAAKFDERGWKAELSLTYEDGKIVKVEYDEVDKDGKKKSEDAEYGKSMKAAKTDKKDGITHVEAYTKLTETALKDDKVDEVTGATTTSTSFKALYSEAKAMRK